MQKAVGEKRRDGRGDRGGRHFGSRVPDGEKCVGKSICMRPAQWEQLSRRSFAEGKSLSAYLAQKPCRYHRQGFLF